MKWSLDYCDEKIADEGKTILILDGKHESIQELVEKMSHETGLQIDWFYRNNKAIIKTLNYTKVIDYISNKNDEYFLIEGINSIIKRF